MSFQKNGNASFMNLLRMIKEDEMKKISIILVLCSMLVLITGCSTEEPNKNSEVEVETESGKTDVPETTEIETIDIEISDKKEWTITELNKTMYAKTVVNVRKGPNTSYEKLGTLSTNESVTVNGQCKETNWYQIIYNGEQAYVSNDYLQEMSISDEEETVKFLLGKKLSIMGDSISTYRGYSNDATNANSTIGENWVWYTGENTGVSNVNQTWWKKSADETGMEILVNNSWSGSQVFSGDESDAYRGRAENLHDDTGENAGTKPDIIAVYIGINDFVKEATFGSYSDDLYTGLIKKNESGITEYAKPQSFVEAYIIMVDKIVNRYTLSDVFLFTFLPNAYERFSELEAYNEVVRKVAEHYNLAVVDLYNDSKITTENYKEFYGDRHIHPNKDGMEAIKEVFVEVLKEKYFD